MATLQHARGILAIKVTNAPQVLNRSKLMDKGLGDNAGLFTTPNPPLPVFANQVAITDKAQVTAMEGAKGGAAARDVQVGILVGMMRSELVYIQSVADMGTPEQAIVTLGAGGVGIAGFSQYRKPLLKVTQGPASGSVYLDANATVLLGGSNKRYRFFGWEYTSDGGKTFLALPTTPKTKTAVTGLTPLTVYGFRVNATAFNGIAGAWSPVVNFIVH